MKITKSELKRIILEEIQNEMNQQGDGDLFDFSKFQNMVDASRGISNELLKLLRQVLNTQVTENKQIIKEFSLRQMFKTLLAGAILAAASGRAAHAAPSTSLAASTSPAASASPAEKQKAQAEANRILEQQKQRLDNITIGIMSAYVDASIKGERSVGNKLKMAAILAEGVGIIKRGDTGTGMASKLTEAAAKTAAQLVAKEAAGDKAAADRANGFAAAGERIREATTVTGTTSVTPPPAK